ncbi:MAG: hypothetical protein JWM46_535 [Candidatus Kaiserbacteria bacterium]|nr:hypothetical protein [Candidatus Kaiserbacteria bacterium]
MIEETVLDILNEYKVKEPPVPVDEIAQKCGINIGRAPSDDFSGFLLRKADNSFIGVNSNDSHPRQRFTIAHELGHYFLHKTKKAFVDYPGTNAEIAFRDNKHNLVRTRSEIEANKFAAALLMPAKHLLEDFSLLRKEELMHLDEKISYLAERYKVSREAMTYRLIDLKLSA